MAADTSDKQYQLNERIIVEIESMSKEALEFLKETF